MFEIGFSELVVIMLVALVVIGPERLPKVARTLGHLWGRAQRYVNGVRADIERDMQMEEMRQLKLEMEQKVVAAQQALNQSARVLDEHVTAMEPKETEAKPTASEPIRSIPANADSRPKESAVPEQQKFPID
jgi:sec-independent protein translocase protein TatB